MAICLAHAAKTLKEMQERNEIVGRAAGELFVTICCLQLPACKSRATCIKETLLMEVVSTGKQFVYHVFQVMQAFHPSCAMPCYSGFHEPNPSKHV